MIEIPDRRSFRPILEMSTPSSSMAPPDSSAMRNSEIMNGRLAGARTAHDTDLLARANAERQSLEDFGSSSRWSHADVLELETALGRPRLGRLGVLDLMRRLLLELVGVVHDSLRSNHVILHLSKLSDEPRERLLDGDHGRQAKTRRWRLIPAANTPG